MNHTVSLNIDLGELPSEPDELYELATIVNVACGGHAGDEVTMQRACVLTKSAGARLAAHPSYPDRTHFGRRSQVMDAGELTASLIEQVSALQRAAESAGLAITAVKPHGALYHDAAMHRSCAEALLAAVGSLVAKNTVMDLIGPGTGELFEAATREGLPYLREGFADRGMRSDGTLIARGQPGALIEDPSLAAHQSITLAESGTVETICVHGDTEGAVLIARAVRRALAERGLLG